MLLLTVCPALPLTHQHQCLHLASSHAFIDHQPLIDRPLARTSSLKMTPSAFETIGLTTMVTLGNLAIAQPFVSSLVRLRANYLPRPLALPATSGSSSRSQVSPGLFSVLRRTYKQQSFGALYAGGLILACSQFFEH